MLDHLIFGKNEQKFLVSAEPDEDHTVLFLEPTPGQIETKIVPNRYWLLAPKQYDSKFVKLKGSLYYQYGKQYIERLAYLKDKRKYNQDNFSIYNTKESFMVKDGYCSFKGLAPKDVSILSFDIETTGLKHDDSAKLLLISNTYRAGDKIERKLFAYDDYEHEGEMISHWCEWVREKNPSVITGHNINGFDFPYIEYIANRYETSIKLGRDSSYIKFDNYESKFRVDGSRDLHYKRVHIYGREVIDTYFLSIKYDIASKKYESYGLKNIIKQEKLEKKDRTFYDGSQIRFHYKNPEEWKKIKEYCKDDADDALALYDLMCPAIFYFSRSIPKPFQLMTETATGSQLNALLIRSYLQKGHSIPKATEVYPYEGGLSFGVPGRYKNVVKWDVQSEYPSCILTYNIYDREKDPEANFYKMVEFFTKERIKNKLLAKETGKVYYKDLEQSQKIGINSAYGLLGAQGLCFNSPRNAEAITRYGRETVEKAILWASGKDAKHWIEKTRVNK